MIGIKVEKRKLTSSGSSIVLTVPKEWIEENNLGAGQEVIMVMNGSLNFMPVTDDNMRKIRNQLIHATRPDEDRKGETREAPVSLKDKDSLRE